MIREHRPHVVAAEVIEGVLGTNANPPRARVRVVDVLNGTLTPGEHDAVFRPDNNMSWYAIREGDEAIARWYGEPCASPETGARVLFAAELADDGALVVWARTVCPDTEEERARLRGLLA
jgi:hypothetical protein